MQNSTLFPPERAAPIPDADRPDPVFWLKRLVLLRSLSAGKEAIVRNLEFRRGLNVVQTLQMSSTGGPAIGHSVGKTLLMRLIRYSLGEANHGSSDTQFRIKSVMETGHVITHWCVGGTDWIVTRPLSNSENSYAIRGADWRLAVGESGERLSHRAFTDAVAKASLQNLPVFTLPRGRKVKWIEVMGWLARDYQCGYRKANAWRDVDAGVKPTLDLVENSLVMQWIMSLMSEDEIDLRLKHRVLLDELSKKKRSKENLERKRDEGLPSIAQKLGESNFVGGSQQGVLSVLDPVKLVKDKIKSLEALKTDRKEESQVVQREKQLADSQDALTDSKAAVKGLAASIEFLTEQIKKYKADPLAAYRRCQQSGGCWMQSKAAENAADPAKASHLEDFKQELEKKAEERRIAIDQRKKDAGNVKQAEEDLTTERKRLGEELSGIDELIGLWKGKIDDAAAFGELDTKTRDAIKALADTDKQREDSLDDQDKVRDRQRGKAAELSGVYEYLLQQVFGSDGVGTVQIDGKGLAPVPDPKLSPSGAAMSVMTCVLCFDIACVAASLSGIGQHPRFLMHDSPREGEMQEELFNRLFEIVVGLSELFDSPDQANFQYIVTTTSELSPELRSNTGVNIVETLHRQNHEGLLLKVRF